MNPNKKVLFTFLSFVLVMLVIACSCSKYPLRESLQIDAAEIPMYPNAQNISEEGPATVDLAEVYTWNFTSSDAPEVVWQFYLDEMSRRWGFYGSSSPQSPDKSLRVQSCPFYFFEMTSASFDGTTYSYTILFSILPCR